MAELSLGVSAPNIQAALAAFGALNKEQQAAVLHANGLVEAHRKLTGQSRDAQREMSAGWKSIAGELGIVTSMAGAFSAALGVARQAYQDWRREVENTGKGAKAEIANFAALSQLPELLGPKGLAQAQSYRAFIETKATQGFAAPADLYAALGAAVQMGAKPGDAENAALAAARQKRLVPGTDAAGFAKAYVVSRAAGFSPAGATNLATIAGPAGGGSIPQLQAIAEASGLSLPDLMALQTTVGAELGKDPEEVQPLVVRAVAGGVRLDEVVSGNLRGSTRRKLKNADGMALLGALQSGRQRFTENRARFRALAAGNGSILADTWASLEDQDREQIAADVETTAKDAEFYYSPKLRKEAIGYQRGKTVGRGRTIPSLIDTTGTGSAWRAEMLQEGSGIGAAAALDPTGGFVLLCKAVKEGVQAAYGGGNPADANARANQAHRPPIPNNSPDAAPK